MTATEMTTLAVRVPVDLAERIALLAEEKDGTVDAEVRHALRGHLDREGERRDREAGEG